MGRGPAATVGEGVSQSTGNITVPSDQAILGMMQAAAAPYDIQLTLMSDDGASMNAPAPQDGQLRVASIRQPLTRCAVCRSIGPFSCPQAFPPRLTAA